MYHSISKTFWLYQRISDQNNHHSGSSSFSSSSPLLSICMWCIWFGVLPFIHFAPFLDESFWVSKFKLHAAWAARSSGGGRQLIQPR